VRNRNISAETTVHLPVLDPAGLPRMLLSVYVITACHRRLLRMLSECFSKQFLSVIASKLFHSLDVLFVIGYDDY
jgi:hypothetical protein